MVKKIIEIIPELRIFDKENLAIILLENIQIAKIKFEYYTVNEDARNNKSISFSNGVTVRNCIITLSKTEEEEDFQIAEQAVNEHYKNE